MSRGKHTEAEIIAALKQVEAAGGTAFGFEFSGGRSLVIFRGVGGFDFSPPHCNSVDGINAD